MGQRLAHRYRIDKLLGQGGFGKVFLAYDEQLPGHPICVVKQLNPIHTDAFDTAKRLFNLEAETLYQLGEHPQIPRLLAHFEEDGELYLVQEHIIGHSLAEEFVTGPMAVENAMSCLQDLLTVLAAVHSENVIHRDIKPSNILRRQGSGKGPQQLVLIDFGAVKALQASPQPERNLTVAIGSLGYMAPEQQASRPCFGSDLYSLGMVMLQALSGCHPISFEMPVTCDRLGLTVPPRLAEFIDRLVCIDHRQRYGTAIEALQAFGRLVDGEDGDGVTVLPPVGRLESNDVGGVLSDCQGQGFANTSSTQPTCLPASPASFPPAPHSQQTYRNRQALLNKVRRFWIEGVLERSLHGQVLLTLGLEERPDAISPPWQITYATPGQAAQPLPAGTQVSHVFNAIGEGRSLLILGEPGAGKTTTLLTLARNLLDRADNNRLPVIFNLSSWLNESIQQWLVKELNSKYQVPKGIGQCWIDEQQLLLLLDGLDEVSQERRGACVAALNQFHQDYGPEMVVCSRIHDYEKLPQKLQFQAALYLRPLTDEQILSYLNRPDRGLTGLKSLLERDAAVQDANMSLIELARSPLILNIMVLTYQGVSPEEILPQGNGVNKLSGRPNYQQQLFDAYIQRMLDHRPDANVYSGSDIKRWLTSLAQRMVATSETVFLIERIQPDWLPSKQRRAYVVALWCSFFAIATVLGSQVLALDRLFLAVLIGSLICSRIFGVSRITPTETLRWSWQKARNNLLLGLTIGPPIGWCLKVGVGMMFGDKTCLLNGNCLANHSIIGLSFGATLGLTFGVIRGLCGKRISKASQPNAGIWQSARSSTLFALVAMIILFIPGLLLGNTKASFWAVTGLAFGFAAGGGEALIKHVLLRLILTITGITPWNYSKFLDYATASIFLQKVGGGYLFIHRLLLEHFAALDIQTLVESQKETGS